jgi:hypothetical protein
LISRGRHTNLARIPIGVNADWYNASDLRPDKQSLRGSRQAEGDQNGAEADYGEKPDSDRAIDGGAKWHDRIRGVYTDELLKCDNRRVSRNSL